MPIIETERYEINPEPLGRGGFGEVYSARDLLFDRDVVVKTIIASSLYGIDVPHIRRTFFREAAVSAKLSFRSPYIVKVFDYGYDRESSLPFFVQEFIPGGDLNKLVGRFSWEQTGTLFNAMMSALSVAHEHGVIHSDISPDNILLDGTMYKLNDFGLAKLLTSALLSRSPSASITGGKPQFIPSDHWLSGERDEYSDLYGLAVTLLYLLFGNLPKLVFEPSSRQLVMSDWRALVDVNTIASDDIICQEYFDTEPEQISIFGVLNGSNKSFWHPRADSTYGKNYAMQLTKGDILYFFDIVFSRTATRTQEVIEIIKGRMIPRLVERENAYRANVALVGGERDSQSRLVASE